MANPGGNSETGETKMKLTEKRIARLTPGRRYGDGQGLYLEVASATNRYWVFRYDRNGRGERWMGLGSLHTINLKEARDRARAARQLLLDGIDPIEARLAERDAKLEEAAANIIFKDAAEKYIALHEGGWRNLKHRQQWRSTLKAFAYPALGSRPVKAIDTAVINAALAAIWTKIPVTATRTRDRIEKVLKWVKDGRPLPVRSAANGKVNLPALPYADIPAFMAELRKRDAIASRALEFLILAAARSGEVLGARWDEINLDNKIWQIPATRMKAGKEHRVPLSDRAIEIIKKLPHEKGNPFVFIGTRAGKPLGKDVLLDETKALRPGVVPHGFRSSFKDWAAEMTHTPNIVSEAALAHAIGDKTEAAYRRGDMLQKRRHLMAAWSAYCSELPGTKGTVVPLRARGT
jgi:integrase